MTARRFAVPLDALDDGRVDVQRDGGELRLTARTSVGPGSPYLAGHFPDRLVLPGVFVLETLRQALATALGGVPELTAVRSLRLEAPVWGGDRMTLTATLPVEAPLGQAVPVAATCWRGDGTRTARVRAEVVR